MMPHEFIEAPGKRVDIPHETVMMLRCKWCNNTPVKAREDGCPMHELTKTGYILLSVFNPAGVERFDGRLCVTCQKPIMGHWLMRYRREYFCDEQGTTISEGIENCIWDVPEGLGK